MVNLSLYAIKAVILLDAEGNRVLSKYYGKDFATTKDQKAFEKGLFDKTKRAQGKDLLSPCHLYSFRRNLPRQSARWRVWKAPFGCYTH